MNDKVQCTLCDWTAEVNPEDPDTIVEEIVQHAVRTHAYDIRLGLPKSVTLIPGGAE